MSIVSDKAKLRRLAKQREAARLLVSTTGKEQNDALQAVNNAEKVVDDAREWVADVRQRHATARADLLRLDDEAGRLAMSIEARADIQPGLYRPTVQTDDANKGKERLVYDVTPRSVHYCLAGLPEQRARMSRRDWLAWADKYQPQFLTLGDVYEEHLAA